MQAQRSMTGRRPFASRASTRLAAAAGLIAVGGVSAGAAGTSGPVTLASLIPGATAILPAAPGIAPAPSSSSPALAPAIPPRPKPQRQAQAAPMPPAAAAPGPSPTGPVPAAQPVEGRAAGGSPPPPRELTPAEITALQSIMTDRARGAVLTPSNAAAIRDRVLDAQRNALQSGYSTAAPQPRPRMMTIDPQVLLSAPQGLQLALGVVTPITFLDDRGRAWPVESVAFDPRMFAQDGTGCGAGGGGIAVMGVGERPSTINIMPCRLTTWGNISVKLQDYPLPVVLMARSNAGTTAVDLPVTIRVQGRSPNTPVSPYDAMAAYVPSPVRTVAPPRRTSGRRGGGAAEGYDGRGMVPDRLLDAFGAGVAPKDAERVPVDDPSVSAWTLGGHLYLRGPVTVINPAHDAEGESVGGMKVWRFDRPVPRVYVIDQTGAERALTMQF